MKLQHYFLSLFGVIVLFGATTLLPHHVGPVSAYPNTSLTPGVVASTDMNELTNYNSQCGTYSQCHRNTSDALKAKVQAEYPDCVKPLEIDHLIPLALGGADVQGNLWCQSGTGEWNYHVKDKLEARLVILMKAGTITPAAAQSCIQDDWVACYQRYFGKTPTYGAVDNLLDDTDDEVDN